MDEISAWLRLTSVDGVGGNSQRKLLAAFGSPEAVFSAGELSVAKTLNNANKARALFHPEQNNQKDFEKIIESALYWLSLPHHHLVTLGDENYPHSLLEIPDPPTVLFVRGNLSLLKQKGLAIVGSRKATPLGKQNATFFAQQIAHFGLPIISGLAEGIDAAAHKGALNANGATLAVIGTGINKMYPAKNQALALELLEKNGAIVSEFKFNTPPVAANFPRRNRLISGLSSAVLVVEANLKSGSLITARLAAEQSREVFAIPGAIQNPFAQGCHKLIKEGAKLVDCPEDILEVLPFEPYIAAQNQKNLQLTVENLNPLTNAPDPIIPNEKNQNTEKNPRSTRENIENSPNCPDESSLILNAMGYAPCDVDTLTERTKLPPSAILIGLMALELSAKITTLPGGYYQRLK